MIGIEPLRWALTAAFAAASAFHLVRSVRPAGSEGRPAESLHLLMGVSMIVMIWPWGGAVPVAGWIAVFVAAGGWFAVRAVRAARRLAPAFFASAMAAMVWMGAAMPAHAASHHAMPGMAAGAGPTAWVSAVLGGYLMAAALWWVAGGMRLGTVRPALAVAAAHPVRWSWLCHGVMSAAMAVALLAMA
jgi:hypothetical protein